MRRAYLCRRCGRNCSSAITLKVSVSWLIERKTPTLDWPAVSVLCTCASQSSSYLDNQWIMQSLARSTSYCGHNCFALCSDDDNEPKRIAADQSTAQTCNVHANRELCIIRTACSQYLLENYCTAAVRMLIVCRPLTVNHKHELSSLDVITHTHTLMPYPPRPMLRPRARRHAIRVISHLPDASAEISVICERCPLAHTSDVYNSQWVNVVSWRIVREHEHSCAHTIFPRFSAGPARELRKLSFDMTQQQQPSAMCTHTHTYYIHHRYIDYQVGL